MRIRFFERGPHFRLLLIGGLAVAGMAVLYRGQVATHAESVPVADVRKARVSSGTLEETLRLTGTTEAEDSMQLRAPYLRGRRSRGRPGAFQLTLEDLIEAGARVREGDVVAEFDPVGMRNRLDDERSQRVNLESAFEKTTSDVDVVRAAHELAIRKAKAETPSIHAW